MQTNDVAGYYSHNIHRRVLGRDRLSVVRLLSLCSHTLNHAARWSSLFWLESRQPKQSGGHTALFSKNANRDGPKYSPVPYWACPCLGNWSQQCVVLPLNKYP